MNTRSARSDRTTPGTIPRGVAWSMGLLLVAVGMAGPVQAREVGTETVSIRVARTDIDPNSPSAVRHLRRRLADAALEACGGSTFSIAETRAAIQATQCWHDAYADALLGSRTANR